MFCSVMMSVDLFGIDSLVHIWRHFAHFRNDVQKHQNETKMKYETEEAEDENITEKNWLAFQQEHKF